MEPTNVYLGAEQEAGFTLEDLREAISHTDSSKITSAMVHAQGNGRC